MEKTFLVIGEFFLLNIKLNILYCLYLCVDFLNNFKLHNLYMYSYLSVLINLYNMIIIMIYDFIFLYIHAHLGTPNGQYLSERITLLTDN